MAETDERDKNDLELMQQDLTKRPPEGSHEVRLYLLRLTEIIGRAIERADEMERKLIALQEAE